MSSKEGIDLVKKYDHVHPSLLENYIDFMQVTEQKFYKTLPHCEI
jgi:hypothetical protein